jgi:hypothetical protein
MKAIDYALIGKAIAAYQRLGFEYIEVPWLVQRSSVEVTCPDQLRWFVLDAPQGFRDHHLIASGEQSFIQLLPTLVSGQPYVCCTPCFRDDSGPHHYPWFMKVELIVPQPQHPRDALGLVVTAAQKVMYRIGRSRPELKLMDGATREHFELYDLEINGLEVGSYGLRSIDDKMWAYGTGLAEPRFSEACQLNL